MADRETKPSRSRDMLVVAIVAIIAMMLGINLFMLFDDSDERQLIGEPAPAFELPVFDQDRTASLQEHRGQVVVLDFWATWCPPCRDQMPALEALASDSAVSDEVVVLSINTDMEGPDREQKVRDFIEALDLTLPTLMDDVSVQSAYGVGTIPTLVVIDRKGRVDSIQPGVHDGDELRQLIKAPLNEG